MAWVPGQTMGCLSISHSVVNPSYVPDQETTHPPLKVPLTSIFHLTLGSEVLQMTCHCPLWSPGSLACLVILLASSLSYTSAT